MTSISDRWDTFVGDALIQLGIQVRDIVLAMASILRQPSAPGIFCLCLTFFFAVVWLLFSVNVNRKLKVLRQATDIVKQYPPVGFEENVGEIGYKIRDLGGADADHLAETWSEFKETTFEATSEGRTDIRNSIRPSVFFNLEEMGFSVAGWRFWPSLFVSIGLAATFLGLIAALQETGESLKAGGDQAVVTKALTQLLTVASAKFIMSLSGLLSSIILTLVLRLGTRQLDIAIRNLSHAVERRVSFVSLEDVAERQLQALLDQREERARLNQDLIDAIAEPLNKAIGASADKVGDMVDNLATSISSGLVAAMTTTSDRLDASSQKLAGLAGDISLAAQQFSTAAERAAAGLDNAADRLTVVSANLERAGNGLANVVEPIVQAADKTAAATQHIADASVTMVESARYALESEKDVVVVAAESIKEQIRNFESRAAAYDVQLDKAFKSFSEEISRSISEVENHSNNVHVQYADALSTLQAVIENAKSFKPESERPSA
jgi:methyl-accepting chemotaxis protein